MNKKIEWKKLLQKILKASQFILLTVVLLVGLRLIDDKPPTRTLDQEIKRIQIKHHMI